MAEELLGLGELKAGLKTELDEQLQLPKVQPILSFVLLLINLSFYGTFINIGALQGPDAAEDFLSGLWLHSDLLAASLQEQLGHLVASQSMAPGPSELFITLWALALVAPRAESAMGYWPFLGVYTVAGLAGGLVQVAMLEAGTGVAQGMGPGACGASAAVMGLLGCLATHYATNRDIEHKAASWRSNDPLALVSGHVRPTRQQQGQQLLYVQSVCVAAVSLGLAGMQHLMGHPSDPGGGAGAWGEVALGIGVLPQLAGFGAGALLTLGMGPRWALLREVHIPEGSMVIPEDAPEMVVVVDRTTRLQRQLSAAIAGAMVLSILHALTVQ